VLAAGMSGPVGSALSLPASGWRETFEVNFFAPLAIAQSLLGRARPNACAIFFSGGGAVTPRPLVGPYAVSKLAVVKLAEQLALDHRGFRFYAIAPGAHDTEIFKEQNTKTGEPQPKFAEFSAVERLIRAFLDDADGRLNGRFIHIRDDLDKLRSLPEGGTIRRIEVR
jgi:NAD(P)-dependent dehydrogenase (short-subunit alcohol dehydrogenase family)